MTALTVPAATGAKAIHTGFSREDRQHSVSIATKVLDAAFVEPGVIWTVQFTFTYDGDGAKYVTSRHFDDTPEGLEAKKAFEAQMKADAIAREHVTNLSVKVLRTVTEQAREEVIAGIHDADD